MSSGQSAEQDGLKRALKVALVVIAAFISTSFLVSAVRGDFALSLAASIVITAVAALASERRAGPEGRASERASALMSESSPAGC